MFKVCSRLLSLCKLTLKFQRYSHKVTIYVLIFIVCVCVICVLLIGLVSVMELFSLEDEEYNQLFITQSSNNSVNVTENVGNSSILRDPLDFKSPCVSVLSDKYSDISDDEFDIPSSQIVTSSAPNENEKR